MPCRPCNDTHIPNIEDWWILVCCAGLFDQLCIKVHVSISRGTKKLTNTSAISKYPSFSLRPSCRFVFAYRVFSFLAKVMPFYCCCSSQDILRIASKTMHEKMFVQRRMVSWLVNVSVCTNFCTYLNLIRLRWSHSQILTRFVVCRSDSLFVTVQCAHTQHRQTW